GIALPIDVGFGQFVQLVDEVQWELEIQYRFQLLDRPAAGALQGTGVRSVGAQVAGGAVSDGGPEIAFGTLDSIEGPQLAKLLRREPLLEQRVGTEPAATLVHEARRERVDALRRGVVVTSPIRLELHEVVQQRGVEEQAKVDLL